MWIAGEGGERDVQRQDGVRHGGQHGQSQCADLRRGQTYNGAVLLNSATVLADTGSGSITFKSTVDGTHALAVNTKGDEVFNGVVGGTTPLASLTTDDPAAPASEQTGGHASLNPSGGTSSPFVHTTGAQDYYDNLVLGANTSSRPMLPLGSRRIKASKAAW